MNKNILLDLRVIATFVGIGFFVFFIYVNSTAPVSVTAQTYTTPTGTTPVLVTSCQSFPNIPGNTACNLSNNVQASLIPTANSTCANGGLMINGNCPVTITALPTKPSPPIIPPPVTPDNIQLIPIVNIIDDSGIKNNMPINQLTLTLNQLTGNKLNFITTPNNQIQIDKGHVQVGIQLNGRVGSTLTISGTLWTYFNGVSLNPQGITFGGNGTTDSNGNLQVNLLFPQGILPVYTFDVATNISFIHSGANFLTLNMSNISITNEKGQHYTSVPQKQLASVEIDNLNGIYQKSTSGQYVQVYPSDVTVTATPTNTIINLLSVYRENADGTETLLGSTTDNHLVTLYGIISVHNGAYLGHGYYQQVSTCINATPDPNNVYYGGASLNGRLQCQYPSTNLYFSVSALPENANLRVHVEGTFPTFNQIVTTSTNAYTLQIKCTSSGCSNG